MKFKGKEFLLQVFDGTDWVSCLSDRSTSLKTNVEQVDTSEKGSSTWRNLSAFGIQSNDISATGLIADGAALGLLLASAFSQDPIFCRIIHGPSQEVVTTGSYIPSFDRGGEYNGAETYSITLNSSDTPSDIVPIPPVEQVATPVISPGSGSITDLTNITITCATAGADIYYTVDGSTPTAGSIHYTGAFNLSDGSITVKAIGIKSGLTDSAVSLTIYTVSAAPTVATPDIELTGNSAAITCATSGAVIHYTIDGTTPNSGSPVYSSTITGLPNGAFIKAIGIKAGYHDSSVASVQYLNANKFIACAQVNWSTPNHPGSSADGLSWSPQAKPISGENHIGNPIASRIGLAAYASSGNNTFYSTTDGNTWTKKGTLSNPGNTAYLGSALIVAINGSGAIKRSDDDGVTFSDISGPVAANGFHGLDAFGDHVYAAYDNGGGPYGVYRSTGINDWTNVIPTSVSSTYRTVNRAGDRLYVSTGGGSSVHLLTSVDGTTWVPITLPSWDSTTIRCAIKFGNTYIVTSSSGKLWTSTDGTTFTLDGSNPLGGKQALSMAVSADGITLCIMGVNLCVTTDDLSTWHTGTLWTGDTTNDHYVATAP